MDQQSTRISLSQETKVQVVLMVEAMRVEKVRFLRVVQIHWDPQGCRGPNCDGPDGEKKNIETCVSVCFLGGEVGEAFFFRSCCFDDVAMVDFVLVFFVGA